MKTKSVDEESTHLSLPSLSITQWCSLSGAYSVVLTQWYVKMCPAHIVCLKMDNRIIPTKANLITGDVIIALITCYIMYTKGCNMRAWNSMFRCIGKCAYTGMCIHAERLISVININSTNPRNKHCYS